MSHVHEPETLLLPGGVRLDIHVPGSQSDGAFVLMTDRLPPGWSLPPHRHADAAETILVTVGVHWFDLAGDRQQLRAGESVHVPRGVTHSGGVVGDEAVERVVVFSPAGMEDLFRALVNAPDEQSAVRLALKHGWTFGD